MGKPRDLELAYFLRAFSNRLRKVTLPSSLDVGESLKRAVSDIAESFADALIEHEQKP